MESTTVRSGQVVARAGSAGDPAGRGRPRDPKVDQRVEDAAMDLFARVGWAGFSIEAVARAAGVGKASVYLRWTCKEDLLTEAVAKKFRPITDIDTGNVRTDLLALATLLVELYEGRHGPAARRMAIESRATPGIAERWQRVRESQVAAARGIARRAINRGDLPPHTSVTLMMDALVGTVINRSLSLPEHLKARARETRTRYVESLVDFVLAGALAAGPLSD